MSIETALESLDDGGTLKAELECLRTENAALSARATEAWEARDQYLYSNVKLKNEILALRATIGVIDDTIQRVQAELAEAMKDLQGREAVADSYALENQQLHDRAEQAEARARETFLTADLEDETDAPDWHERVLRALASQLRMSNDFYYPLLGAAQKLTEARKAERQRDEFERHRYRGEPKHPPSDDGFINDYD